MYMANAEVLRLVPNATYIPLTCVGVKFALPNAKDTNMLVYFALADAKVLNANGFASQWNIGFTVLETAMPPFLFVYSILVEQSEKSYVNLSQLMFLEARV